MAMSNTTNASIYAQFICPIDPTMMVPDTMQDEDSDDDSVESMTAFVTISRIQDTIDDITESCPHITPTIATIQAE